MEKTEKLNMVLPSKDDAYNIDVFNDNFRIIDENIGGAEKLDNLLTDDKTSLVGAINEVFQDGGNVKQQLVDVIVTADSTITISTDNTYEEICKAIMKIATNWVAKDKDTRKMIAQTCNQAETTDVASLGMYPSWENVRKFILQYLTNG